MRILSRPLSHLALMSSVLTLPVMAFAQTAQQAAPATAPRPAATATEPAGFSHPTVARDAVRYEAAIKAALKAAPNRKSRDVRIAAEKVMASGADPRAAARGFSEAVVLDANDTEAWLGLARALLAIPADPNNGSERYELPVNGAAAAYIAYERARTPAAKAQALVTLAEGLQRRSYWRPAIDALKASVALVNAPEVAERIAKLQAEHGFRLVDYKVENDSVQPRLCIQFSESLARTQGDFAKFITVDGRDPQGVTVEAKQLCIDGLAHGRRYEIQVRGGLPSDTMETLGKPAELGVYVKDRGPSVRFSGKSYVLPSKGQQGIPVVTVNTEAVKVDIYRVGDRSLASTLVGGDFQKQMSGYDLEGLKDKAGAQIYSGRLEVAAKTNEEVTTAVPVGEAIPELKPGVYVMVAVHELAKGARRDNDQSSATQWFIVSDLGLTALSGEDGIHAFVRSLADTAAIANASVRLVARNNEILGTAKSDANGYVRFEAGLKRGEGGMAPAILVAEGPTGDYAFLDLSAGAFDLSDRGVKGRDPSGPLDAFLYAERGVYRPGEMVHLTGLVRDRAGRASSVPMTLIISRPDGVEHRRIALTDDALGGREAKVALAGTAMTGTWRAKLHADPKADPLANVSFLVEDFVPERLELKLEPVSKSIAPDEAATVKIAGRYLYGPPAANLAVEGDIVVKPSTKDVEGYAGYRFGRAEEKLTIVRKPLDGTPNTGADGRVDIALMLPAIARTARPLEADILLRLREPGGRTIERTVTLPVDPKAARIGIKPLFKGDEVAEGEAARFEVIKLVADGRRAADGALTWTVFRLEQNWQWYSRDGQWNYEAVTLTRKVATGTAATTAELAATIEAKADWGRYRIEVASADGSVSSSMNFRAGWYGEEGADSPEFLEVALDKPSYKAGETAKLKVVSKTGGRALVTVLSSGLLSHQQVDVPKGGGEIAVEVGQGWGAGAYIATVLYRPLDVAAKRMPGRALGIRWLALDQADRTLKVAITTPDKVKSAAKLTVPVKLDGLKAGEDARITIAAVDAGILNLTRYQPPSPEGHFHAQRRLGVEVRDYYSRLIDGMRAERGKLRSGGDGNGGMSTSGSPPVETLVALHSGIVKVAADGTAQVEFQLPEFNGTVRVMAVAWSADKLGHAMTDVIVRDPVALIASAPRFLTLGDEARIELDLHNVEGAVGSYKVAVEQESATGAKASILGRDVTLNANQRVQERFKVKPTDVGRMAYDVRVTGPNGVDVKRRLTLDVKVPAGDIRRYTVSSLGAKGGKITLSPDLAQDLVASRTQINLTVGPAAAMDVSGLLTQLDRYPYGCAEQTTSRALPLLYANALSAQSGLPADPALKERIQAAIERVLEMQDASGAFGIWGPRNGDMWLSAYVTDFLTRAKESGYSVKPQALAQALDKLQNFVSYAQDFEKGGEARAYALYVLARNSRAAMGDLRYYVDTRLERFSTPLAKAQLGAALAMLGDKERAEKAFKAALAGIDAKDADLSRLDYGSGLRDRAGLLTLAAETKMVGIEAPQLASVLAKAYASKQFTSTQEQAWMLLAARAVGDQARDTILSVNGQAHKGPFTRTLRAAEIKDGQLTITNEGDTAVDAVISVIGAALTPEPAVSKGFKIERTYYTLDGKKVDMLSAAGANGTAKQSDRFVVVLKVEAMEEGGRIMLVDRLPAGLEVENPRLVDGGDVKTLDWLKSDIKPEHTEFRDDRFVAAFNLFGKAAGAASQANGNGDDAGDGDGETANADVSAGAGAAGTKTGPAKTATVAYIVRAVTPGSFVHPAATVEDMYRPSRFARTASGRLDITAKE
jgi:alpha-2-macroglobulin